LIPESDAHAADYAATNPARLVQRVRCHHKEPNGTLLSYKLELVTALGELGKETLLSTLTPARILEYFTSDRVMNTRTEVQKARPTFLKSQRVLRFALVCAQEAGLIEKAPLPEGAATF
jgi:hypothetical protein